MTHGPLAVWDYYLTNYDKNGNVRVEPSKTTFNVTGEKEISDAPAFWSPATEISNAGTGEIVIMFNERTEVGKVTSVAPDFMTPAYYQVSFFGMKENEIQTYLRALNVVKVGETQYNKVLLGFGFNTPAYSYCVAQDSIYGGLYIYLNLTTDGLTAGENTVTLQAEGYEDLTFTINK